MNAPAKKPLFDKDAVTAALRLILAPGQVTELRCLEATLGTDRWSGTLTGYFDDPAKLAPALAKVSSAKGIYFTPNPINPALLARAKNRIRKAPKGESTQDTDVVRRHWLLIDADAVRPAGISSSASEHDAAIQRSRDVYRYLKAAGWPDPIPGDSGNGAHLMYRIDLPADDGGLVQRCLVALATRFDDGAVHIDQKVFNPARIWKLYGTLAGKGDDTEDRPHRMAKILHAPADVAIVPAALLEQLAASAGNAEPQGANHEPAHHNGEAFDVEEFLRRHQQNVDGPEHWHGQQGQGRRWVFKESPMCGHHDGAAYILEHNSGAVSAGCHHNSCNWGWQELRAKLEPAQVAGKANATRDDDHAPLPAQLPWPVLDAVALYGLAGEIVRAIEPHTEADPVALLVQLLAAFGNIIGRTAHFVVESTQHFANLFVVLVGKTARARKGTSEGRVRAIMRAVDEDWATDRNRTGLSSGEGLVWNVRDPIYKVEHVKEKGRIIDTQQVLADPGIDDKRLLVIEPEFANVLRVCKRETNTLSATLRTAWDTGLLRTMVKNNPAVATGAHVSIVGHITQEELHRELSETESFNGFANRFLWLAVKRSKLLPEGGADVDLSGYSARLADAVALASSTGRIRRDPAASRLWHDVYCGLADEQVPGTLGAVTSRADAQLLRLSLLYALLDGSGVITPDHIQAALGLWRYCAASCRLFFGGLSPLAEKILALINERPGIGRAEIHQHAGKNKPAADIVAALVTLRDNGLVVSEPVVTSGRPAECWYPAKREKRAESPPDGLVGSAVAPHLSPLSPFSPEPVQGSAPSGNDDWGEA